MDVLLNHIWVAIRCERCARPTGKPSTISLPKAPIQPEGAGTRTCLLFFPSPTEPVCVDLSKLNLAMLRYQNAVHVTHESVRMNHKLAPHIQGLRRARCLLDAQRCEGLGLDLTPAFHTPTPNPRRGLGKADPWKQVKDTLARSCLTLHRS